MSTTTLSYEARIDTELAEAHTALSKARDRLESAIDAVRRSAGQTRSRVGYGRNAVYTWNGTLQAALTAEVSAYGRERTLATYAEAVKIHDAARAEVARLDRLYTGWSRFFLVANNNGHIHSSMDCSTCYIDTQFRWLPSVSGKTEADAVAEFGEILCSICFPSAPVAWTMGESKEAQALKAERAAQKAEREAKKLEKALLPDGSELKVATWTNGERTHYDHLATLASAKMWLTDAYEGSSRPEEAVAAVVAAVAAKTGETPEAVIAAAKARAAKRK